jgi:hypothetical protein
MHHTPRLLHLKQLLAAAASVTSLLLLLMFS